jgi:hypothetical protein
LKPLATDELLELWDTTSGKSMLEKSLRLLSKVYSTDNIDQVARLSIGERDARLLEIREWLFGKTLRNKANCQNCSETIEWESNSNAMHLQDFPEYFSLKNHELEKDSYYIKFRLLNSADLLNLTSIEHLTENSYKKVISKCILSATKDNQEYDINNLPESVWEALNDRMSEEDPQADIRMQLVCPNCNHSWEMNFDIGSYLWSEINVWAKKILEEVYLLAGFFRWSEKDILNMSSNRRRLYIDMIRQ